MCLFLEWYCSSEFTNAFMTQAEFYIVFDNTTAKNQDMLSPKKWQHTHLKNKLSASCATASYGQYKVHGRGVVRFGNPGGGARSNVVGIIYPPSNRVN